MFEGQKLVGTIRLSPGAFPAGGLQDPLFRPGPEQARVQPRGQQEFPVKQHTVNTRNARKNEKTE